MNERALRQMACLAHTVPGVTLVLGTHHGDRLVVGRHHPCVVVDPCQFRRAVVETRRPGHPRLVDTIASCEVVGGVIDIGGGLYQGAHPSGGDERWFTTLLRQHQVSAVAAASPLALPADAVDVVIRPDLELGVCVVRVGIGRPGYGGRVDEAAFRLLSACMVDEVVRSTARTVRDAPPGDVASGAPQPRDPA